MKKSLTRRGTNDNWLFNGSAFGNLFDNLLTNSFIVRDDLDFRDTPDWNRKWATVTTTFADATYATDDAAVVELAVAGYSKENITLDIVDNKLTISAPKVDKEKGVVLSGFTKTYALRLTHDVDNISATFVDGLLTVTIPFKEKSKSTTKQIEIK